MISCCFKETPPTNSVKQSQFKVATACLCDVSRLTEVVCHHGRSRDGRLGELFSPAALLLQVLQTKESRFNNLDWDFRRTSNVRNLHFYFSWKMKMVSHLCSDLKDRLEIIWHRRQFRLQKKCKVYWRFCFFIVKNTFVCVRAFRWFKTKLWLMKWETSTIHEHTCSDTTIVLEWDWMCRPPGAPRDLTKSCSCAICLFRLLMSCKHQAEVLGLLTTSKATGRRTPTRLTCLMMYVSSSISTALSSNKDFLFATKIKAVQSALLMTFYTFITNGLTISDKIFITFSAANK